MGISLILRQILFTFEAIWRGGGNLIFEWLCFVKFLLFISMECCWREILEGTCLGTHDSSFTHSLFGAERSECALLVDCELFKQVVLLPSLEPEILKKAELKLPVNSLSLVFVIASLCLSWTIMTANVQGSNILDVLKKKMRATKEECEKFKEEAEDLQRKLGVEINRREDVN